MTAFEELGVIPELGEAVSHIGWELPTPIQCEAIPTILGGGDVLIAAETGSGKTGAFCLPVAQIVWEKRKEALEPKGKKAEVKQWSLNLADRDYGLSIAQDGLSCESRSPRDWCGARATAGVHTKGKYYYEAQITRDGLCRVGWATDLAALNIGTDDESFGFGGTGKKSHGRRFEDYGRSFTAGDVLGCFLDLDNLAMWWSINGEEFPRAYNISKSFATFDKCLHPAVLLKNSTLKLNLGDKAFIHPPGRDFIGVSKAASECVHWWQSGASGGATDPNAPLCVVLEPTRELVEQTHNNLLLFSKNMKEPAIRCISLAAGAQLKHVVEELGSGCDIVTSTPHRLVDLVESDRLSLKALQFIVIDEADQFLADKSSSGAPLLERLFRKLPLITPDGTRLQVIVCSATLHNFDIKKFADIHMHFPQWIDLKGMDTIAETVHHVVCTVDPEADKQWIRVRYQKGRLEDDHVHDRDEIKPGSSDVNTLSLGTKILKGVYVLKAIEALKMEQCIVFCRTKQQCDHMEAFLIANGHPACCLHGDRSPEERKSSLEKFKTKEIPFLICTDVVARGLDVHGVPFVINVTLPPEKELYVHRIGRVGRAERMGLSISLVSANEEKVWYHKCPSRGNNCHNTRDLEKGGCTIMYNEMKLLSEIEDHIGQTIASVDSDFRVPVDEFDGKIVYGAKRTTGGVGFEGHAPQLATSVAQLADLERSLQTAYLAGVRNTYTAMKVL